MFIDIVLMMWREGKRVKERERIRKMSRDWQKGKNRAVWRLPEMTGERRG